jgi:uncharacterized membrane protein YdjX (TVP38/TMEM64 family)
MPLNQIDLKARAHARVTHKRTSKLPLIISLGLLITLIASYFIFPGYRAGIDEAVEVLTSEDEARVAEWVSQFGIWGPLMIIVGMVLQMFFFIIPNILLIFISVVSYGPVWGSLLAWFGMLLASTTGYFIGNKLSHVIVDRLVSPKTQEKLREFIRMYGMKAIIALRVSSLSNDGLSLVLMAHPARNPLQSGHIDDEAVPHVTLEHSLVCAMDILHADHLYIGNNIIG